MSLVIAQLQSTLVWLAVTGALIYWYRSWRRSRTPGLLAMVKALAALNVALILGTDFGVANWLFGVPTLPNYLVHVLTLFAAYFLQLFVLHLAHPTAAVPAKVRVRTRILVIAELALGLLYLVGPVHSTGPAINGEAGNPALAVAYLAIFEIYLGIAMFDVVYVARHARELRRGYLRTGLRLLRWGGITGLVFVAHKVLYSLTLAVGFSPAWAHALNGVVAGLLTTVGILLLMAGVTVPAVGPRHQLRRHYRQLEPLWRDLTAFAPEVKFSGVPTGRTDITDRVRQRMTEINDVLVGPLQAYLDPAVYAAALADTRREAGREMPAAAVAQAVTIATALASAEPVNADESVAFTPADATDDRDEAAWFAAVATAYTTLTRTSQETSSDVLDTAH
ncbi:MAB_1171c family putative transporter [Amycolatopsis sp. MtRt-6]|uniref:MAB_1171c family putative transporter n=1 Tax=Amycolatopsis sp. MtRt-6 TaxID=2792782 RepID=UPI001A8CF664|nr:MAB_1171c family putative transporter [Amycolatopsis sp. MtRt-6]